MCSKHASNKISSFESHHLYNVALLTPTVLHLVRTDCLKSFSPQEVISRRQNVAPRPFASRPPGTA